MTPRGSLLTSGLTCSSSDENPGRSSVFRGVERRFLALVRRSLMPRPRGALASPPGVPGGVAAPNLRQPFSLVLPLATAKPHDRHGTKHDVFTKTNFAVKLGQPMELRIDNTDKQEPLVAGSADR
jgi:hypothetical protein